MKKMLWIAALAFSSIFTLLSHANASGGYWDYTMDRRGLTFAAIATTPNTACASEAPTTCPDEITLGEPAEENPNVILTAEKNNQENPNRIQE